MAKNSQATNSDAGRTKMHAKLDDSQHNFEQPKMIKLTPTLILQ